MSLFSSMSLVEILLSTVIFLQLCLLAPKLFKMLYGLLGFFPFLSGLLHWIGGNGFIAKVLKSAASVVITLVAGLSGYYQGYNRGYDDAKAGQSRSWTASIWRMWNKDEKEKPSGGWLGRVFRHRKESA